MNVVPRAGFSHSLASWVRAKTAKKQLQEKITNTSSLLSADTNTTDINIILLH